MSKFITALLIAMFALTPLSQSFAGGESWTGGYINAGSTVDGMGFGGSYGEFDVSAGSMSWTGNTDTFSGGVTMGNTFVMLGGNAREGGFSNAQSSAGENTTGTYAENSSMTMSSASTFGLANASNTALAKAIATAMRMIP